jgi:hypothetical protein
VKYSLVYEGGGLLSTIFACHSWKIALNLGLDVPLDNMQDWKGIREKAGEVNSAKVYVANDENSYQNFNGRYTNINHSVHFSIILSTQACVFSCNKYYHSLAKNIVLELPHSIQP